MRRLKHTRLQPLLFFCCFAPPAANPQCDGVRRRYWNSYWVAVGGCYWKCPNASECWLLGMLVSGCCAGRFGRHSGVRRALVAGVLQ